VLQVLESIFSTQPDFPETIDLENFDHHLITFVQNVRHSLNALGREL
jgi:hypothetical protein